MCDLRVILVDGLAVLEPGGGCVVGVGGLTVELQCALLSLRLVLKLLEELDVRYTTTNTG